MYENEIVKEEEKIEYKNRETGEILTEPVSISYYKSLQNDQIIENFLLGDFDKAGKYIIEKKYLIELVKLKKYVYDSLDNKYILKSMLEDKEFKFTLVIDSDENENKKVATLRLIELCNKEDDSQEILKTIVATYKDDDDIYFLKKVYKVFNIFEKSSIGDNIDEEEMLNILNRYRMLKTLRTKRTAMLDHISSAFVDEILAILRANPSKFSEYVLRQYGNGLLKLKDKFSHEDYYILIKKMLLSIINGAIHEQKDPNVSKLLNDAFKNYIEKYNNMHKELLALPNKKIKDNKEILQNSKVVKSVTAGGAKKKASKAKIVSKNTKKIAKAKKAEIYYFNNVKKSKFNDYKEKNLKINSVSSKKSQNNNREKVANSIYSLINNKIDNIIQDITQDQKTVKNKEIQGEELIQ